MCVFKHHRHVWVKVIPSQEIHEDVINIETVMYRDFTSTILGWRHKLVSISFF